MVYVMYDPSRESSPNFHHMFLQPESSPIINHMLNLISSIWEDDCIDKIDNNQCKCLWCGITFQVINYTKDMARVLGIMGINIKCCF